MDNAAAKPSASSPYILLGLLMLLNIMNYTDRLLLKSFVVDVKKDLGISYFQFSLLTGLAFAGVFAVAILLLGPLSDRYSRTRLIAVGLIVWSAMTAASGFAASFGHLVVARGFVAIGEATFAPAALSLLGDRFKGSRRGTAFGIYYLGLPIGSSVSLFAAGFLGPSIGWRGTFMVLGAIGIVAALIPLFLRDVRPVLATKIRGALGAAQRRDLFATLRTTPELRWLLLGATLVVFAQGGLVLDQAWLVKERGYQVAEAQKIFGLIYLGGGVAGALLGGAVGDWSYRALRGGRAMGLAYIYLAMTPLIVIYRYMPPHSVGFYVVAFVSALSVIIPFAAINAAAQEYAPERIRATVTAAVLVCTTMLGAALGNIATGVFVDHLVATGSTSALTTGLVWNGAVSVLGIPCFVMAGRHWARRGERT